MYQALYRKWRPQAFEDVVGQSHITQTLRTQVDTGRLSHAYLFTGTRGTGKTTCAKILAKAVNCENPNHGDPCNQCAACKGIDDGSILDVVELDAASNNGVDQVRALREEAVYSPTAVKKRVYIVDEVHMLTTAAFNALLKIMEEPPEHLMFILATTELHKVPATILSRCQRFSFQRITAQDIQGRLTHVAKAEGIPLTDDGAALLARLADGALRDGLSLLDQCAAVGGKVDRDAVLDSLGLAGNLRTAHLMNHIRRGNTAEALTELSDLYAAGKGVAAVLSELSSLTRDLLIIKTAPKGGAGLMAGGYDEDTLFTLGKGVSAPRLLQMLRLLQQTQAGLRTSANQRTDAELCLMQLCDPSLDTSNEGLAARLTALEEALASGISLAPAAAAVIPEQPAVPIPPISEPTPPPPPADPPPWEMDSPAERVSPPAVPRPTQTERRPAAPKPQPTKQAPAAVQTVSTSGFWTALLPLLKVKLKRWAFNLVNDPSTVTGRLEQDTLVIYAVDVFSYNSVNKEGLLQIISQAASMKAGREVNAVVRQGTAPPEGSPAGRTKGEQEADAFQELMHRAEKLGIEVL